MNRDSICRVPIDAAQREINRLLASSRADLDRALVASWTLGCMLRDVRDRVRRTMGRSAWPEWLRVAFPRHRVVALRWSRFAEEFSSVDEIAALSLRQAYFRLGVSTEPKSRTSTRQRSRITAYVRNSQRLVIELRRKRRARTGEEMKRIRGDLAPLFRELTALYDGSTKEPRPRPLRNPENQND